MVNVIEHLEQTAAMMSAPRAIVLVSVPWSPWPQKSRRTLAALEATRTLWSPNAAVEFFDLWPERNEELNRWYDELCASASPRFALHGDGYGPFWWMVEGKVLKCLTRPYEIPPQSLQQRSAEIFHDR